MHSCKRSANFSREQDLRLLVPMVRLAEEMALVRSRLVAVAKAAGEATLPPLGGMIETPAAALSVAELKASADFLSIGTNDLTQFTTAAGLEIRRLATTSVRITFCGWCASSRRRRGAPR